MTRVAIAAAAGALLIAAATAAFAGQAAAVDLGDAPEGTSARYGGKPAVIGAFPSKSGPRLEGGGPRLGTGWSAEAASRQVDRDGDDGAGLRARSCGVSTLDVVLDLSRVEAGAPVYVNAWFDWNQDGDWADGGSASCGPEWGVQNERVDRSSLDASGVGVVRLRFRAGRVPAEYWWRLQVHTGTPAPHAAGAGATGAGEVEDFREGAAAVEGEAELRCRRVAIPHGIVPGGGGPPSMDFYLVAPGLGARISPASVVVRLTGDTEGIRLATTRHLDFVEVAIRTRRHSRDEIHQRARIEVEARAVWPGGDAVVRARCPLYVAHSKGVVRPYRAARLTAPAVLVAVDPVRPDPTAARCAADYVRDGLDADILVHCKGVHPKTLTVSPGTRITALRGSRYSLGGCSWGVGGRSMSCSFRKNSRSLVGQLQITMDEPYARMSIFVTAGGHGARGTTHVLRQDWLVRNDGVYLCSQTIPKVEGRRCSTIKSKPEPFGSRP